VGQYEQLKRFCLWTKVHQTFFIQRGRGCSFSSNVEGVVIDKILFRFAIYRSIPEIFAIKVESCQKSRRILDVFSSSQILGAGLPKVIPAELWRFTCFQNGGRRHLEFTPGVDFCSPFWIVALYVPDKFLKATSTGAAELLSFVKN